MNFVFYHKVEESLYKLTIKRRKEKILVLEEESDGSHLMPYYDQGTLPESEKHIIFIIRKELTDKEEDDIWDIDEEIEIGYSTAFSELKIPVLTFWSEEFLTFAKRKKWLKFKLEVSNEKGRFVKTKGEGEKGLSHRRFRQINPLSQRILAWLGVPTEEEWIERNKHKKSLQDILNQKKQDSE